MVRAAVALLALGWAAAAPAAAAPVGFTAPADLPVGDSPEAMVAGDFNADGDVDLAVVNRLSYTVSVLLGGPGASFASPTTYAVGPFPQAIAAGDLNPDADLDLDLVVINRSAQPSQDAATILLGGAGGSFAPAADVLLDSARRVALGDFNGDSDTDLAVTLGNPQVAVHLGGSGATFGGPAYFSTGAALSGVTVGEFNGDSDPDLVVANGGSDSVSVLLGTDATGGSFGASTQFSVGDNPQSIATADFNGDADPDLAVANTWSRNVSVLLGTGATGGNFGTATNYAVGDGPSMIAVADFDGDGKLDLAVANGYEPAAGLSVLRGHGDGVFDPEKRFEVRNGAGTIAAGDFNADGDPDVALANAGSDSVSVLLNTAHRPGAPTLASTDPGSPANQNAPKVTGQAEAGSTVRLYSTVDCSGGPAATGSAADFASPGLTVAVPDDSTTTFRATATNAADVPSVCSSSAITYVEHSSPPKAALAVFPQPGLTATVIGFDASTSSGFGITRYEWDLDGNGDFEVDTGAVPRATRTYSAAAELNPGVRVSNDLGSSVARAPLSIRLAPPPGALGASINGGAQFTNDSQVSISIVWPPLASMVLISNDGGFARPGVSPVAPVRAWNLDSSGPERLPKTVYVRFDGSSQTFTDDIILDETPPRVTGATAGSGASSARAAAARARTYTVRITARDATSGVRGLQITTNKRKPGKLRNVRRTTRLKKTVRFRSASSRIYVRVRDAAGNYSAWRKVARRAHVGASALHPAR